MKTYPPDQQHSCKAAKTCRDRPGLQLGAPSRGKWGRDPTSRRPSEGTAGCSYPAGTVHSRESPVGERPGARVSGGDLAEARRGWAGAISSAGESGGGGCPAGCTHGCQPTSQIPSSSRDWLDIAAVKH